MILKIADALVDALPRRAGVRAEGGAATSGFSRDGTENWLLKWGDAGMGTASGQRVNAGTAMHASAYFACIRNVSEDIGRLPISVRRLNPDGSKSDERSSPVYWRLHRRPNPDISIMTFVETLNHWAMGWGNGYAEIAHDSMGVPELFPIHPSRVAVARENSPQRRVVYLVKVDDVGGGAEPVPFRSDEILHIHGLGDGLQGYSVFRLAQESIGISLAQDKFSAAFYGNGTHVGGVIESKQGYSVEQRKAFRDEWDKMYTGGGNAFKTPFLPIGLEWKRMAVNPMEAELIQSRQFQVSEIARWFRVPPHIIQDLTRSSFNNIEVQGTEYVRYALMPWIKRWELEIDEKLLDGQGELFAEFNTNALMRGDMNARANYYRTRFNVSSITPNQIRLLEGENPSEDEGADSLYIQANMVPLSMAGTSIKPGQVPNSPEEPGRPEESALRGMMPVAVAACERVLKKEKLALSRTRKKMNDFQFGLWMKTFYETEVVDDVVSGFGPILTACGIAVDIRDCAARQASFRMSEAYQELTYNPAMDGWETRAPGMAEWIVGWVVENGG